MNVNGGEEWVRIFFWSVEKGTSSVHCKDTVFVGDNQAGKKKGSPDANPFINYNSSTKRSQPKVGIRLDRYGYSNSSSKC